MLMDRKSAYNSCFDAQSLEDGFRFEWNNAKHVVSEESVQGMIEVLVYIMAVNICFIFCLLKLNFIVQFVYSLLGLS